MRRAPGPQRRRRRARQAETGQPAGGSVTRLRRRPRRGARLWDRGRAAPLHRRSGRRPGAHVRGVPVYRLRSRVCRRGPAGCRSVPRGPHRRREEHPADRDHIRSVRRHRPAGGVQSGVPPAGQRRRRLPPSGPGRAGRRRPGGGRGRSRSLPADPRADRSRAGRLGTPGTGSHDDRRRRDDQARLECLPGPQGQLRQRDRQHLCRYRRRRPSRDRRRRARLPYRRGAPLRRARVGWLVPGQGSRRAHRHRRRARLRRPAAGRGRRGERPSAPQGGGEAGGPPRRVDRAADLPPGPRLQAGNRRLP